MGQNFPPKILTVAAASLCCALLFAGCGKAAATSAGIGGAIGASASDVVESAIASTNSVMNDVEQVPSYAFNQKNQKNMIRELWSDLLESSAYAAACGVSRFIPPIGSASCAGTVNNETVTSSFGSCTAGPTNQFTLNGSVSLAFDLPATCNAWIAGNGLPASGNVFRTSSNFMRTNPDGTTVTSVSDPAVNYLSKTIQGGSETVFGAGSRTVAILGLNRVKKSADGQTTLFNHSVYTTTAFAVSGTRAANNRTIATGTVQVDHNIMKYSASASLAGLAWASACCYPSTGSVTFVYTGSVGGSFTADFNTGTCGLVTISAGGGSTQVSLAACE